MSFTCIVKSLQDKIETLQKEINTHSTDLEKSNIAFTNLIEQLCYLEEENDLLFLENKSLKKRIIVQEEEIAILQKKSTRKRKDELTILQVETTMIPKKYKREVLFNKKMNDFF